MDYSKWRKIAIILAIISLFINIFSKVFASYDITVDTTTYKLPDVFENYSYYVVFKSGPYYYAYASNNPFYIGTRNSDYRLGFKTASYGVKNVNGGTSTDLSAYTVHTYDYTSLDSNTGLYGVGGFAQSSFRIYLSNHDVYWNNSNTIYFAGNVDNTVYPYFSTPDSEINNLSFDKLYVEPADFGTENPLYLHTLQITQTVTDDNKTYYYYTDNLLRLDNTSPYYTQFLDSDYYYYGIPRRKLGFQVDSTYLLVLSDSPDIITTSVGPIVKDDSKGIYEAVSVNTENIYTYEQVIDDNIQNIQDDLSNTDTDITDNDISNSFNYDIENQQLTSNHNGFFSRLLSLFTNLYDYDLSVDTPIEIPLPNTEKKIILHSNIISSHIAEPLKSIITAFWMYVFYLYSWKFFNYIFIEIETGKILDDESDSVPGAIHTSIL